jgi:hypothetical protein
MLLPTAQCVFAAALGKPEHMRFFRDAHVHPPRKHASIWKCLPAPCGALLCVASRKGAEFFAFIFCFYFLVLISVSVSVEVFGFGWGHGPCSP